MLKLAASLAFSEPRLVLDGEGRILNWNEEMEHLLGRSPLQGRRLGEFLSGGDDNALTAWLAGLRAHEGRSLLPQALTLRTPDGAARRVELAGQGVSGRDGFCVLVLPLPAPSCPVAAALEHLPAPAAVLQLLDPSDPDSLVFLGFNAAARALAGQDLAPLAGRRLAEAVPAAREHGWAERCVAVARGGDAQELDLLPLAALIPGLPARASLWPLPERCVGVSAREEPSRAELDGRSRLLLRSAAEMPAAVTVWALPEGTDDPGALRLVAANRAGEALLPRSAPVAAGQALRDILPAEASLERWRPLVLAVREGRPAPLSEWPWLAAGGATRTFARQCVPLGERLVAVLSVDITDRKRAEEALGRESAALAQRNAELASANRELRLFAHAAAADLQEPLRGAASAADQLARRYGRHLDADGAQLAASVSASARRMHERIRRMLAYAALDPHALCREPVALETLVAQAQEELRPALDGASVAVGDLPLVEVDPVQLRQLFQELLANAAAFRGAEPLRIEIGARAESERWLLWVRDNGRGVPAHLAERIFALSARGRGSPEAAGSGLGLALCRKIVEAHGGRIWAEPGPVGVTFRFTLPRAARERLASAG